MAGRQNKEARPGSHIEKLLKIRAERKRDGGTLMSAARTLRDRGRSIDDIVDAATK